MKKMIIGFVAGILVSTTGFMTLRAWQINREKGIQVELVSDEVGSGSCEILRWRFSEEMVPAENPVEFSPTVEGTFSWTHPNELVFQPNESWRGCTPFSATLSGDLRGVDARPLAEPRIFTFRSDPLAIQSIAQSNYSPNNQVRLDLAFSEKVSPAHLKNNLKLETPSGQKIDYAIYGRQSRKTIGVNFQHTTTNEVVVRIGAGLQSIVGTEGLESNVVQNVTLSRKLRLLRLTPRPASFETGYIEARFNLPVDLSTAKDLIRVEPEIPLVVESGYSRNICRILGDFKPATHYQITLDPALGSTTGTSLEKAVSKTVHFPDARPAVEFTAKGSYLSPKGGMKIPIRVINSGNCKAIVTQIYSNNLVQLAARQTHRYRFYGTPHQNIGHVVGELELPIASSRNETSKHSLDLRPVLEGQTGAFHIEVISDNGNRAAHYVVVSDIGLSIKHSKTDFLVWANSLRTLAPLADAEVKVYSLENQVLLVGKTDADGIARLDLTDSKNEGKPFLVVIEKDGDLSFLRLDRAAVSLNGGAGRRPYLSSGYEACLFTDRGIYRPGETAHVKVVVRDPETECPAAFPLTLKIYRPDGKVDRTLTALLNEYGTAEFELPWPEYAATGRYRMEAAVPGGKKPIGQTLVSIEEFVPPQIRTHLETPTHRIAAGEPFEFTLLAEHLFGGAADGLSAQARIDFMPHPFTPPQWKGFAFGDPRRTFTTVQKSLGKKMLDTSGAATFRAKASPRWRPAAAIKAIVSGTAMEASGRSVTAYNSRTIDAYPFYIGLFRPTQTLRTDELHSFKIATVRPDGSLEKKGNKMDLTIEKLSWASVLKRDGEFFKYCSEQQATPVVERGLILTNGQGTMEFKPTLSGHYRLCLRDPDSAVSSSLEFHVTSPGQSWSERSMESPDKVKLELNKKSYLVGDTATLSIKAPFLGKLLLTVETDHMLSHQILTLTNNTAEVELPIGNEHSPNAYCTVSIIRPALPEETWGQHRATGRIALVVEKPERRLDVQLDLPNEIRPGTRLEIPLRVTDANGDGCSSEVVLAAVDEGICMLTGFQTPDPFAFFFAPRLPAFVQHDLYAQLMPEVLEHIGGTSSAPGGGMLASLRKRLNPVKARRFKPVALWSGSVKTTRNGTACVVFNVPEFTGQLRIMAVALDRSRFGSADQQLLVKRPLVVQSSLPRFLALSDSFTLPVTLHNESKKGGQIHVEGSFAGKDFSQHLFLATGGRTNLEFQLVAPAVPGKATCDLQAIMGQEQFKENIEIAVRPPTSRAIHSGSGMLAAGKTVKLAVPFQWMDGTGEAEIHLSSMPTIKLKGSIDYLLHYPYGCLEQTVSKSMPLLYLEELAEVGELDDWVNAGIHRVLSMQKNNGGFSLWPNDSTYAWGSIYATHFLLEARAKYDVPKEQLDEALDALEKQIDRMNPYNATYACHVLALAGRPQHGSVARLLEKRQTLLQGAQSNLAAALIAAGKRRQALELLDSIGINPSTPIVREIGGSLCTSIRSDALLLSVLLDADPDHKWVPMLARRLDTTRWRSTQENAIALMALGKYCIHFDREQKNISGRINAIAFKEKEEFKTRLEGGEVVLQNSGEGPLHYFWKSEGVPADGCAKALDKGLAARRQLLKLDGSPADPLDLRQGKLYIVKTTLTTSGRLDNIVIEDLLPAGLEIENSTLRTSQNIRWIHGKQTLPIRHTDIRDDRMLAFTSVFSGEQTFYYAARAVTVGDFAWPALSATCMYNPAIQSVHGAGRIKVLKD